MRWKRNNSPSKPGLSAEELKLVSVYNLVTLRPIVQADAADLVQSDVCSSSCCTKAAISVSSPWVARRTGLAHSKGTTAWEAASAIHSDLQKGFIRAEIISFDDFIQAGGETQAKRAGKMRLEQKEYVMQDCDITNFRTNK